MKNKALLLLILNLFHYNLWPMSDTYTPLHVPSLEIFATAQLPDIDDFPERLHTKEIANAYNNKKIIRSEYAYGEISSENIFWHRILSKNRYDETTESGPKPFYKPCRRCDVEDFIRKIAVYYDSKLDKDSVASIIKHLKTPSDIAVICAARYGIIDTLKELLLSGANKNAFYGITALGLAVREEQEEAVRILLIHGAETCLNDFYYENNKYCERARRDLLYRDERGTLSYAVESNNVAMAKLLLTHGAQACGEGEQSLEAWPWAIENNHTDVVPLLLEQSAPYYDYLRHNHYPHWIIDYADRLKRTDISRLIIEDHCKKNANPDNYYLESAAKNGFLDIVQKQAASQDLKKNRFSWCCKRWT